MQCSRAPTTERLCGIASILIAVTVTESSRTGGGRREGDIKVVLCDKRCDPVLAADLD